MKRREFIRLGGFLTASVAAISMTGCDIVGDNDNTSTPLDDSASYPNPSRPMPAAATGNDWQFPQSVASGDPKHDSIILWTRVIDSALAATAAADADVAINLRVTAADNSGKLDSDTPLTGTFVADVTVPAYEDFDGTIRHKLSGLAAGTVYYFQFKAGDVYSRVGRFKTAPAASSTSPVKFAFMSCQDWSSNHWGVFTSLVEDDIATPAGIDFVVHLGDYIYETDNDGLPGLEAGHGAITFPVGADMPPERTTGPSLPADPPGQYAVAKADYRYLYKLYRSDARIQRMHERFPMVAVWDDHEFSDDSWQNAETYTNRNAPQLERRREANQAWFEFMPADVTFQEVNPSFQNIRLYRDLQFGQVMHLVMTDERLYRQDHLIPEDTQSPVGAPGVQLGRIFSRYLAPEASLKLAENIKDASSPNMSLLSMLGATQRDWWKSRMKNSPAVWKVWGNEVSLMRMGLNGSKAVGTLIALQTLNGTYDSMNAQQANTTVQALPKVAAGAGTLVAGFSLPAATAIQASFVILMTLAAGGDGVAAGESVGLTTAQATAARDAIVAKSPTAAEVAICAATVVAATTAYMTTNLSQADATTAAGGATVGMLMTDAAYGGAAPDAALLVAAKGSTALGDAGGTIVVNVYKEAKAAAGSGTAAQIGAGATAFAAGGVMLMLIRNEVETYQLTSSFVIASGQIATLGAFLRKFIINADQWDGYRKERADLLNFLASNNIDNVVAVTGDIHAFFAGTVHAEHKGEITVVDGTGAEVTAAADSSPAVMVDLVTAGVSSTSWYNYLKGAAAALSSSLVTLVSYTLPAAATGLPFDVELPVLDFSMGKPFSGPALVTMVRDAVKAGAAANGIPESALGGDANITTIASTIAGNTALQGLCAALAAMGTDVNPWLKHVDTNAQGYAVVTASTSSLDCEFRRVNAAFVNSGTGYAPGVLGGGTDSRPVVSRTVTATVTAGTADVQVS